MYILHSGYSHLAPHHYLPPPHTHTINTHLPLQLFLTSTPVWVWTGPSMWPLTPNLPVKAGGPISRSSTLDNGCPPTEFISNQEFSKEEWEPMCPSLIHVQQLKVTVYAQSRQLQLFWDHDRTLIFWHIPAKEPHSLSSPGTWMENSLLSSVFANLQILPSCLYLINYLSLALIFLWAFPTSSWLPTIKCIPPGLLWVQLDWMRLCCSWRQSCSLLFLASLCDHPHHWTPNNRLCQVIATILEI